jgi:hypothetical protein
MKNHLDNLKLLLSMKEELIYGFVATQDGSQIAEAGEKDKLPNVGIVTINIHPESIRRNYLRLKDCELSGPSFVPQLCGQRRSECIMGIPVEGIFLAVFSVRPEEMSTPEEAAKWLWNFRTRIWQAVRDIWGSTKPWK